MDWSCDNAGLSSSEIQRTFKFQPQESTVLNVLEKNHWHTRYQTMDDDSQWERWVQNDSPSLKSGDSGLVLLIARRAGEPSLSGATNTSSVTAGKGVRTLPFSQRTFENIIAAFRTHSSIARVIARADVPIFRCEKAVMDEKAIIYSCRSSNAWAADLALAVTHYPRIRLTFAILFGCPISIEMEVMRRLSKITTESAHPLLMPTMFAELEHTRHAKLVSQMTNEVQAHMSGLDYTRTDVEEAQSDDGQRSRRTVYLHLTYMKNSMISWDQQLAKMVRHSEQILSDELQEMGSRNPSSAQEKTLETTQRITERLSSIRDIYDDTIRHCTMHLDGMAMATQWAQGDVNTDIAMSTSRDSKHMRSIALVTMVFLPGTFFASIFSMAFFDWSGEKKSLAVSPYIWIYILVTICFTALTIGLWYYITIYRKSRNRYRLLEADGIH